MLEVIVILMMSSCGEATMLEWLQEPTGLDVDAEYSVYCSNLKPQHLPLVRWAGIDAMFVFVDYGVQPSMDYERGYAEADYDPYLVKKQVWDYNHNFYQYN